MNPALRTTVVVSALIAFFAIAIWGLGDALFPLMLSFALAYLAFPIVKKLEEKGISRNLAVFGIFGLFIVIFILLALLVVPELITDARAFAQELPELTARALARLEALAANFGYDINLSNEEIRTYIIEHNAELSGRILKSFSSGVLVAFSSISKWLISVVSLFLIPLFFFYVINDYEKISAELKSFIPPAIRPKLRHYFDLSNRVLSGYIRGQLMVALSLGCLYAIGLTIVGLRFSILIGILTGLLSIIPYAGFTVGFATAALVGLANSEGSGTLLGIAIVFGIVQALEGTVITPKLVGNKVGLSALATMLALIIGGNIAGLTGMLIAIPVAAIAKSILIELKAEYISLNLYKG